MHCISSIYCRSKTTDGLLELCDKFNLDVRRAFPIIPLLTILYFFSVLHGQLCRTMSSISTGTRAALVPSSTSIGRASSILGRRDALSPSSKTWTTGALMNCILVRTLLDASLCYVSCKPVPVCLTPTPPVEPCCQQRYYQARELMSLDRVEKVGGITWLC